MKMLFIGMGPGNGRSIARRFGKEGFEIIMLARDPESIASIRQELSDLGIASQGYTADISDSAAYGKALENILAEHPQIDILHYNASAFNPAMPSALPVSVFQSDLQINIVGALQAYQAVFPQMKARNSGVIFLTGGGTAFQAPAVLSSLGVGKAGMRNLAFSMAEECRAHGIHVATVTICGQVLPGTRFDPELTADIFWDLYQQKDPEKWQVEVVME